MSLFDGLTPTYIFRIQIELEGKMVLDTSITTKDSREDLIKTKKTVRRLLDEYAPLPPVLTPAPEEIPPTPEPDFGSEEKTGCEDGSYDCGTCTINGQCDRQRESEAEEPEEAPAPAGGGQTSDKRPEGARGLLRLYCRECGNTFGTFLKERQSEITCRCGHHIDLTAPLALYRFTCPYCQHEGWGKTNSEDPEIEVQCKCREMVTVRWNRDAREYQN